MKEILKLLKVVPADSPVAKNKYIEMLNGINMESNGKWLAKYHEVEKQYNSLMVVK